MGGIGDAISGVVSSVENVVSGVGSAFNAVTDGVANLAGGVAGGIFGPEVGDMVESFTHIAAPIALGIATGGIGDLGLIGEAAGFADPLSFISGMGDIGGLGGIFGDLAPNLGNVLGGITDSGFPFGNILSGLTDQLGGGGGLISGLFGGGPGGVMGSLLGGDPSKLMGGLTNGAGGVLQSILGQLPQLSGLFGGGAANPLGILSNLPNLAGQFNPADVLNGLKEGLGQLASQFPNISDTLKNVLGQLNNMGGMDPKQLLQTISSQLGQIPEMKSPLMPFNPADMLGMPAFANQFLGSLGLGQLPENMMNQIGKTVQDAVNQALKGFNPSTSPVSIPASTPIKQGIMQSIQDVTSRMPAFISAGASTVGGGLESLSGGPSALVGQFEKSANSLNDIQNQIAGLDLSKPEDQAKMQKLNFQASQIQTMMTQISKMLKDIEDLLKQIVANS